MVARNLQQIREDHRKFLENGGNVKRAKDFNNCAMETIFDVSLDQVIIVQVHIECTVELPLIDTPYICNRQPLFNGHCICPNYM